MAPPAAAAAAATASSTIVNRGAAFAARSQPLAARRGPGVRLASTAPRQQKQRRGAVQVTNAFPGMPGDDKGDGKKPFDLKNLVESVSKAQKVVQVEAVKIQRELAEYAIPPPALPCPALPTARRSRARARLDGTGEREGPEGGAC